MADSNAGTPNKGQASSNGDDSGGVKKVWADPYSELPFRSDKYAGNCQEMHLGGRRLTGLREFKQFRSMGVLWINDNALTSFAGLESNFRLKEIYAHNNKMVTLNQIITYLIQ